jgi:foldase protein PrsA
MFMTPRLPRVAMLSTFVASAAASVAPGCGTAQPGGMSRPTINNHVEEDDDTPAIQSNDVLARDANGTKAKVKHILISWADKESAFGGKQDPRAQKRSRAEADELAVKLLERVRAGEDMDALMREFSDDPGSAQSGTVYDVTPTASLVFEFKRLALRLKVGEAGMVMSVYGWHIMKRLE